MRDCENCKHRKENGCEKLECEFEPKIVWYDIAAEAMSVEQLIVSVKELRIRCSEQRKAIARHREAWEKAKAKLGNYSLYPVNEWVGLKRAMEIVLETLGEVGENNDSSADS